MQKSCPAQDMPSEQSDTDADADEEDDSLERADSSGSDEAAEVFYDAVELELARSLSLGSRNGSGAAVGDVLASLSLGDDKEKGAAAPPAAAHGAQADAAK